MSQPAEPTEPRMKEERNKVTPEEEFRRDCQKEIRAQGEDESLRDLSYSWLERSATAKYSYHFEWMGRPIIQYPQDMIAVQEILWRVQPELVIETGIAHGGSLVFSASMLELIAISGGPSGQVLAVDIDIRAHNRKRIEEHPMARRISMIEGSSTAPEVVSRIQEAARGKRSVLVLLDSDHTHEHVLAELEAYAPLVTVESYCVVFDTAVELMPADHSSTRRWGKGNNPRTAVRDYLNHHQEFEIDKELEDKLLITVAPGGFLRRIR